MEIDHPAARREISSFSQKFRESNGLTYLEITKELIWRNILKRGNAAKEKYSQNFLVSQTENSIHNFLSDSFLTLLLQVMMCIISNDMGPQG